MDRLVLSDEQWERISPLIIGRPDQRGSTMTLTGAIYTPAQSAEWSGNNGSASSNCTRIIAKTVSFIGNSELNNAGCEAMGVKPIKVTRVRVTA